MTLPDPAEITSLVVEALEKLQIQYFIGGSLASSVYGIPRATQDVDIIADIKNEHVANLVDLLKKDFYIDENMIRNAIKNSRSFNIVHLKAAYKIDMFIFKGDLFSKEEMRRKLSKPLGSLHAKNAFFASPEDVVISKLLWYKAGGSVSERQLKDITGIIKLQGARLDYKYLRDTASSLDISQLLDEILKTQNP